MSSARYSACLLADPVLRRVVLASGLVFAGTGTYMLLAMPVPVTLKVPAALAWLLGALREVLVLRRAYARYRALEISPGDEIRLLDRDGDWHGARLLPGSILLRRLGWIRICDGHGRVFGELLQGSCREGHAWRRLQLLWRHVGAHS